MNKALVICLFFFAFVCSGCATLRNPVPFEMVYKAQVKDMPEVRYILGQEGTLLQENIVESVKQEDPKDFPLLADGTRVYPVLCISGGGSNGAYGAGFLKGWSEEGSRPNFKVVTGVSTGAIIAPFAFLGKEYDAALEKYYTTTSTKDVLIKKGIVAILFSDSLASTKPLVEQLVRVFDRKFIDNVAAEHLKGKRLFVGTTNLEAQKFVVWDMGAIACRGDADLFRKVILASASIPTMFPPVYFRVLAEGKEYDEMHVDGGAITQVFTIFRVMEHMSGAVKAAGLDPSKIKSKLYIIRNGYVSSRYEQIKDSLPNIAARTVDTILNAQGVGDTFRIYVFAKERGNDYNLAFIPPDFKPEAKEAFDPKDMRRLFDRGYQDSVKGYSWFKTPLSRIELDKQDSGQQGM